MFESLTTYHVYLLGPVKKTKKEEDSDHSLSEGDVSNVDEQEVEEEEEDVEKEKGSNRKQTKKRRLV